MSDGLPPASPENDSPQDSVNPQDFGSEATNEDSAIGLPEGGQYPDDMFGIEDSGNELVIELPGDASAGGLADVGLSYGDGTEAPLPPAVEPQPLAEMSIDPLPAPEAGGEADMFAVNDLMDDSHADADAGTGSGDDLFSVDQFADEPAVDQSAAAVPLPTPEPLSAPEPLATPEPLASPEPLATPEPLAAPEALPTPEPVATTEPLATPEPPATSEPLATPEPLTFTEPPAAVEPSMAPEPLATPEPLAFESSAPLATPEPPAAEPVAYEQQPVVEPPAFTEAPEPTIAEQPEATAYEAPVEPVADSSAPLSDTAKVFSEPPSVESPPPLASEDVSNPYADQPEDAGVSDPAMATVDEAELPSDEEAEHTATIVNPYADMDDDVGVLDPAMALKDAEAVQPEPAPTEVFVRTESEHFVESTDPTPGAFDPSQQYDPMGAPAELPPTNRTESIAPPGMENMVVGGLVVANGGRATMKSSKGLSLGRRKKSKSAPTPQAPVVQQPVPGYAPDAAAYMTPQDPNAAQPFTDPAVQQMAAHTPQADPSTQLAPNSYAQPIVPPAPVADAKKSKKRGKKAKQPKAAKAPKQGSPLLDSLFGKVEPGQRHAFFGIKFGPVEPTAEQVAAAQMAAAAPPMPEQAPVAAQPVAQVSYAPVAPDPAAAHPHQPVQADPSTQLAPNPYAQPIVPPAPVADAKKSKKRGKKAKQPKAAKAPKQGSPLLDSLFGKVEPGQRHAFFGIKFGPVEPTAEQVAAAQMAAAAPPMPEQAPVAPAPYAEASTAYAPAPEIVDPYAANPYAQSPVASPTDHPLVPQTAIPAPPSADDQPGAQVIQSAEAAAHAKKSRKRGKKPKKAKQPKAAKAPKQGSPLLDSLFGKVEPGQRHAFFGIKFGPVEPTAEQVAAAQMAAAAPPMPEQAPVAPAPYAEAPYAEPPNNLMATPPAQQPVQPVAPQPTPFPGGNNPAAYAPYGEHAQPQAAAAGQTVPQQIVPPVEQTAQLRQGQQ